MITDIVFTPDGRKAEVIDEKAGRSLCKWGKEIEWFDTSALSPFFDSRQSFIDDLTYNGKMRMHYGY